MGKKSESEIGLSSANGLIIDSGIDAVGQHTKGLGRPTIVELRKPVTEERMKKLRGELLEKRRGKGIMGTADIIFNLKPKRLGILDLIFYPSMRGKRNGNRGGLDSGK